jgi:hypothetical protein
MHSPADLRILEPRAVLLGAGNPNSLQNIIAAQIPNGALCYVVDQSRFYVFDKFSTAAVSSPTVIATARGASVPGRWRVYAEAITGTTTYASALDIQGLAIGNSIATNLTCVGVVAGDYAVVNMDNSAIADFAVSVICTGAGVVRVSVQNVSRASTNFADLCHVLVFHNP